MEQLHQTPRFYNVREAGVRILLPIYLTSVFNQKVVNFFHRTTSAPINSKRCPNATEWQVLPNIRGCVRGELSALNGAVPGVSVHA